MIWVVVVCVGAVLAQPERQRVQQGGWDISRFALCSCCFTT